MAIDFSKFAGLAEAVERAGAPILAAALRATAPAIGAVIPFPGASFIIPPLLNALADALGGDVNNPDDLASKITSDPATIDKVRAVEAEHETELRSLIDLAQLQADQNKSYETISAGASWRDALMRFFFAGWRPSAGWVFVGTLFGVLAATAYGWTPPPNFERYFEGTATIFMALIAARTGDKIFGVATNSLKEIASSGVTAAKNAAARASAAVRR